MYVFMNLDNTLSQKLQNLIRNRQACEIHFDLLQKRPQTSIIFCIQFKMSSIKLSKSFTKFMTLTAVFEKLNRPGQLAPHPLSIRNLTGHLE